MTRNSVWSVRRADSYRRAAFTLIELLTVMAIILLLAGLVLGLAGSAQNKAASARATSEIQALSTAAGSYQADNGSYPRVTTTTDGTYNTDSLDARSSTAMDPGSTASPTYSNSSVCLYRLLSGLYYVDPTSGEPKIWPGGTTIPKPTVYFPFKDSQLKNPGNVTTGYINPTMVTAIMDPYGLSYGYSTAYQADVDANTAAGTNTPPLRGYNPTFDLWSTAGYSTSSGKAYPSDIAAKGTQNTLWIKNW